jgi:hypothetical protein
MPAILLELRAAVLAHAHSCQSSLRQRTKSEEQKVAEADVVGFRQALGPFVALFAEGIELCPLSGRGLAATLVGASGRQGRTVVIGPKT